MAVVRAYRAERAFDGQRVVPGGLTVVVEGARIVGVEPAGVALAVDCPVTFLPGTTVLPGLIDAHVHLCGDAGPDALAQVPARSAGQLREVVAAGLARQLAAGVTTVRDLGDHEWAVLEGRQHGRDRPGPRVLASGPPVTTLGGHCASMGGVAQGRDQLADAVRQRARRGADLVKVMVSGGAMTAGSDLLRLQYAAGDLAYLVERAHADGLPVNGHAHSVPAVEACLTAGVDGIEHATCLTGRGLVAPPRLLEALAAAGTWVCPTLGRAPGSPPSAQALEVMARTGYTFEARRAQVGRFAAGGVRLVSGSDAGIHPGKPHGVLPHAVAELVQAGIAPAQALASATSLAAEACGVAGVTGRLRPGLEADLLIVDGDPVRDIADLTRVRVVVRAGVEHPL